MKMTAMIAGAAIAIALPPQVALADNYTLTTDHYAPYTIVEGSTISGIFTELVNAALKQEGHTASYQAVPWARATSMTQEGEVTGTIPWFKTPEREAVYLYSDPIIDAKNVIFIKKGGRIAKDLVWNGYADLKPYKMGGTKGYWYEEGFRKADVPLDLVNKDDQNVQKLEAGRIDGFITDELVGWALIKKMLPGKEGDFDTVSKPDSASALHVMGTKKNPDGAKLITAVNNGMKKIKASGEYDKIVAKYKK